MCKVLRHDDELRVNSAGFAVAEDIISRFMDRKVYFMTWKQLPTVADLIYVVNDVTHDRFQASALEGTYASGIRRPLVPRSILFRCVQGHSGNIGR